MSDFSDSDFETDTPLDIEFAQATEHVQRTHATHAPNDLLPLYALFKQATIGRCNTAKPSIFQLQGRAKWSAWNELGDMSVADAKQKYVSYVEQLDPSWSAARQRGDHLKSPPGGSWVVHSTEMAPLDDTPPKPDHEKTALDFVKEGNLSRLQAIPSLSTVELCSLDENGMGLIHWAADRNAIEILRYLLTAGADVNLRDTEQQTALHYAASCGHVNCVRLLLSGGADRDARDAEGQTCLDVAESSDVRTILEM